MLLGLWLMLGVFKLNVLGSCMNHYSCPFLCMVNEAMIWKEKERSMVWAVQIDSLRGLLGIRKMNG